jgi:parallel beta-helix repeat protein
MNDDARSERLLANGLADLAPTRAPGRLSTTITAETARTRPRPRWLAVLKEPPMRISSTLAVGSPTARVAAIVAATLLIGAAVAGAGIAGSRILGADGSIVVDPSGGGDYRTIAEAVANAADGDTVLVRPGTYIEAVVVDKDITLTGDGPVEDIVISAPDDGPTAVLSPSWGSAADPFAVQLLGVDAELSNLTFRGERSTVVATGGDPAIKGLVLEGVGIPYRGGDSAGGNGIVVNDGSTATLTGNVLNGGGPIGIFDLSEPLVEGNTLSDGPHIWGGFGDGAVIRGNTITGPFVRGIGLFNATSPLIEGNTISGTGQFGVDVGGGGPRVTGNTISGRGMAAINVTETYGSVGVPVISGNTLTGNGAGIAWDSAEGTIEGNTVREGTAGIVILSGAPLVAGNVVEGLEQRGLVVGSGTSPTLSGNTSCGNGENLRVADGATPVIDDTNEICEDAPAG